MQINSLKWNIHKETIEECLRQAFNTFTDWLQNQDILKDENEWIEFCDIFLYDNCFDKIQWLPIKNINAESLHHYTYSNLTENSLYGMIVIINDNLIIDGNHRYNTLCNQYRNDLSYKDLKVPVLNIYYEY